MGAQRGHERVRQIGRRQGGGISGACDDAEWRANQPEIFQGRFEICTPAGDQIADELINVDVQAQQVADAAPQPELVVGDEIMSMDRHE